MKDNTTQRRTSKPRTRKEAKIEREVREEVSMRWWSKLRLFPMGIRILVVLILIVIAAVSGAMIGYSVMGEGDAIDVLKISTWRHIFDIMNGVVDK
ncbi:DNA-directed RNA polymerase subunit beta [Viridibacillus sp. YIM B01967]|uniref:DNA-directed RNA polymerase subunit beta n=2 Tax=Viridibacillus soli TaxID=2798301 RepID=A0ABS1H873_9BACL|nr:DNA-directed RNA polymerase subunit beta [Viridibacillus soli]